LECSFHVLLSLPEKGGSTLKTRAKKAGIVSDLNERFARAKGAVLAEFSGLSVEEMTSLRVTLRKSDVDFKVLKNTLARQAAEGTPSASLASGLKGQVGVALGYDDPVALAKAVLDFAKSREDRFRVRMGVIEGKPCDAAQLKAVASLPSREVLLGQMAGTFQAPVQKMAGLLMNTVTRFAYALEALKERKAQA